MCSPISSRVDVRNYPHLTGLQFANTLDSSDQQIGLLIGAGQYYEVVLGEVIKGSSGPIQGSYASSKIFFPDFS